ncbi:hypothetical protein ACU5DF_07040 [Aliivibrio wodanis]|uniref:Uncharacterized protein n=1 Tax=Aliivibrio wodanis TaxID=80852 RepID=A0A090IDD4_9GAMM|nr:putative uncharacterized protein [Aliivibrio wodanis]VVV05742.1 hypothetical protein AW0309160_03225 [Aliivibrio wodanis]
MSLFYVDKNEQANGEHEVHTATCTHSPGITKCEPLGYHTACSTALNAAKEIYPKSNGCYYCSYSSYTSEDK